MKAHCLSSDISRLIVFWMTFYFWSTFYFLSLGHILAPLEWKGSESVDIPQLQMSPSVLTTKMTFHKRRKEDERVMSLSSSSLKGCIEAHKDCLENTDGKGRGRCLPGESPLNTLMAQPLLDLYFPGWYFSWFQINLSGEARGKRTLFLIHAVLFPLFSLKGNWCVMNERVWVLEPW